MPRRRTSLWQCELIAPMLTRPGRPVNRRTCPGVRRRVLTCARKGPALATSTACRCSSSKARGLPSKRLSPAAATRDARSPARTTPHEEVALLKGRDPRKQVLEVGHAPDARVEHLHDVVACDAGRARRRAVGPHGGDDDPASGTSRRPPVGLRDLLDLDPDRLPGVVPGREGCGLHGRASSSRFLRARPRARSCRRRSCVPGRR